MTFGEWCAVQVPAGQVTMCTAAVMLQVLPQQSGRVQAEAAAAAVRGPAGEAAAGAGCRGGCAAAAELDAVAADTVAVHGSHFS